MTKYQPERDLPDFAREYKTLSPSKLSEIVLMRRNKKISPESVTMWFKRHEAIADQLAAEIIKGLPTAKEEVDRSIFETGNFETLPSIKNWIMMLQNRDLSEAYQNGKITMLKRICTGQLHTFDLVAEGKWVLKHPDRLTLQESMELIAILKGRGIDTYAYKRDLKDFLECKGIPTGKKFVVGKPKGYGKLARLHVPRETLDKVLNWVKQQNFIAYVVDKFMFKTGTRINSTLEAKIEELREVGNRGILRVYDKGRFSKYPEGHPWDKYLDAELLAEIKAVVGDRKTGKVFSIGEYQMRNINRVAVQRFCPEILAQFPDFGEWNHFWRHMFAQHMLRLTNWNYGVVASLGGWTPAALEESYGKPPEKLVEEWAEKFYIA
jgi:integrase